MKICKKIILEHIKTLIQSDLNILSTSLESDYDYKNKIYCFKYLGGMRYASIPKIGNIKVDSISVFPLGSSKVWYKNIKNNGYKYYVSIQDCIIVPFFRYKNAVKYLDMWKHFLSEVNI